MCKFLFLFVVLLFKGGQAETSFGKCTDVEPMPGFNINKFLGLWYVIQTTAKSTACLSYYVAEDVEHAGQYQITEIDQHSTIWSSGLHHEHNTTGELTIPDPKTPGRMNLDLPLDIGTSTFTVFMSDYNNYAAIFTCKKYPLINRWSAKILSRTHTLDMSFVDKVRTRLASYNIDPFELAIVSQKLCPKPGAKGSIVRTASNVVTGVKNTISNVVTDVEGTVKDLVSDPSIRKNADTPRTIDVRNGNAGQTISEAANDFGQKVSGVMGNLGQQASGVVHNIQGGVSKALKDAEGKFDDLTSAERTADFNKKLSNAIDKLAISDPRE